MEKEYVIYDYKDGIHCVESREVFRILGSTDIKELYETKNCKTIVVAKNNREEIIIDSESQKIEDISSDVSVILYDYEMMMIGVLAKNIRYAKRIGKLFEVPSNLFIDDESEMLGCVYVDNDENVAIVKNKEVLFGMKRFNELMEEYYDWS